jgi:hypothetical protein
MQHVNRIVTVILATSLFVGCAAKSGTSDAPPPEDGKSVDAGFVYGYVETNDEIIERIDFIEYGKVYVPPFSNPPRVLVYNNGVFMAENIKPGKYIISGFRSDRNHYNLARNKRLAYQKIFIVEPGELEYLGAYNVFVTEKGRLDYGGLKVHELQRPGERDVLKELYHLTEGTVWQQKIARRLKELRQ